MEEILRKVKKVVNEAEVFSISRRETNAVFEANRLKQVHSRETSGKALRVIKDGKIGLSASNKTDCTEELISMAVEVAAFGAEAKFKFPQLERYPLVEVYDSQIEKVTEDQMVKLGQSLIDNVLHHTSELVCEASVSASTVTIDLINSRGGQTQYKKSIFGFNIEGVLIRSTDMLFVGDSDSSCHPLTDTSTVIKTTIEQLERSKETVVSPLGQLPVIFTPIGVTSAFIAPLATAVNGKTVLQGASPLGTRKGEKVFDSKLSVTDDALIDYRPGSRYCDAEGIPSQRTPLIENGVVTNFLYDLQTAALSGAKSTGSAARDLASLPSPSVSSLIIQTGENSFEDILADMKKGLIVEQLIGASQGNVLGGEFSGNILLGYAVENGRITGRVKDTMVSGNIYDVLKDIAAISKECKWIGGRLCSPFILCPRVAVSSKS